MVKVLQKFAYPVVVVSIALALGGCFDLGEPVNQEGNGFAAQPTPNTPPSADNAAPRISGTPGSVAVISSMWAFTPNATDPDGDPISFNIQNKPVWADFDNMTGKLSGMPQLGHEGNYANIRISASDGKTTATLPDFAVNVRSATTNAAPVISGNPSRDATIDQAYMFVPAASDANGDRLTFAIANRPDWANFNTTTGQLSGTPMQGDSAFYDNIVISVTDGEMMASLPAFSINVSQIANISVTLSWTPPTQNEDSSPLTDLVAYKIYYGLAEGNYPNEIWIDNPGISTYVVDNLSPNTYFFVATSINSSGMESNFSNVAIKAAN
jgi:hypothetical protein